MSSRKIVDLRKKKTLGASFRKSMQALPLREAPKRSSLKARRRRVRGIVALVFFACIGVAAFGVSYVSHLPRFSIQEVEIEGTQDIRENALRTYVESILHDGSYSFLSRSNIFLYPRTEIERAITEYFPRVESVGVSRDSLLASAIVVAVKERVPFARWCTTEVATFTDEQTETCYLMDDNGFIFAPVGTTSARVANLYVFQGDISTASSSAVSQFPIGERYLPGTFAGISKLLERLGQTGFAVRTIRSESERDFSVGLTRGFELRLSFGSDIEKTLRNLGLVFSSESLRNKEDELEYIDLRFGNRVYYKFRGEDQQAAE